MFDYVRLQLWGGRWLVYGSERGVWRFLVAFLIGFEFGDHLGIRVLPGKECPKDIQRLDFA